MIIIDENVDQWIIDRLVEQEYDVFSIRQHKAGISDRDFFLETWQMERNKDIGIEEEFVQDNWSRSMKLVLRGLYYQKEHPQGELVSVRRGRIYDVAVDIRSESPICGEWYGEELSDDNHPQLCIPPGFAHEFAVLSEVYDFVYKCTDYRSGDEGGTDWNDGTLKIDWKVKKPDCF